MSWPIGHPFLLETDASGAGVITEQPDGTIHPLLYTNHTLQPYERISELEALGVAHFCHYLYGHRAQYTHTTKLLNHH